MKDSEKTRRLVEDYQKAQRALGELNVDYTSEAYQLGRKILTTWWLRFIKSAYDIGKSVKWGLPRQAPRPTNNINFTDTLALYDYKIAVYTCIVGNYDRPKEPVYQPGNVDYLLVTDGPFPSTGAWKGIDIHTIKGIPPGDATRISRYVKLHPHLFLDGYDYSIYVDGNIKTVGDMRYLVLLLNQQGFASNLHRHRDCIYREVEACIRLNKRDPQAMHKQINAYRNAGMPEHYGLIESCLLVRDHHNPLCIEIMERWWKEILQHSDRDQLSLPFVLWQMGIPVPEIGRISDDAYKIPLIQIHPHAWG